MYNPDLYFNYLINYIVSAVLVIMLVYAVIAKIVHDYGERRQAALFKRFTDEIHQLFWPTDVQQIELSFSQRLDKYYEKIVDC